MKKPLTYLLLWCVLAGPLQATEREVYVPPLEEAPWRFEQSETQCLLLQSIPRAGEAVFISNRERQLQFSLQGFRHPAGETLALIRLDPPAWQHGAEAETLQEILLSPQGELTRVDKPLASRLLQELEHGRVISLFFPDWGDAQHALTIQLLPVGFRTALKDFLACPDQLPVPPPPQMPTQPPQYTLWFATDRAELTEAGMQQVKQICDDVKKFGDAVERVVLEARADERGSDEHNLRLSEARAQTVAEALVQGGVPQNKLEIHPLGERQPQPPGSDLEAWRKNRRVVVTLLGKGGKVPQPVMNKDKAPSEEASKNAGSGKESTVPEGTQGDELPPSA